MLSVNLSTIEIPRPRRSTEIWYHARMDAKVRRADLPDKTALAKLRALLWPRMKPDENFAEIERFLTSGASHSLPTAVFVVPDGNGGLSGFIEASLRSHADGCDPARPVGFIEGWFVCESSRNQGIGKQLMHAAEEWAWSQGCKEMASDVLIDNPGSQRAHEAAGFEVVDRCVHFRKDLREPSAPVGQASI